MTPNNNVLVVYRSFLGATKRYAQWLSDELDCQRVNYQLVNRDELQQKNSIVVMSGTYAGRMPLVGFLKKYWPILQGKRIFVVAVGAVPPESPASERSYRSIPADIRTKIWYIKMPGRLAKGAVNGWKMKRDNIQRIISAIRVDNQLVK